ncbi:unnamed protein product [Cylicostephanus goldi]|uniref:Uncharacterized protein n=1 Tax=Cylicostephanus goldi TaxID=71465 RepID=A0A3P7PQ71_CYLGO|nr:unnamed protein product [Cylicostephanus goldi]
MALGNGYVNEKMNIDTSIRYAYGHGIIDEKTWNTLERDCCNKCIDTCDFTQSHEPLYSDAPCLNDTDVIVYMNDQKANVRVLLYYGDTDMACNFMMGQQFSDQLGLKTNTLSMGAWSKRVRYGMGETLEFRGAGHMAPQWRAPQMYYVIQQFLLNHPI